MQLQRELGNIKADVEDVWVVRTHTCIDTSCADLRSVRSSNGSSLGQWAGVERALARITHWSVCWTGTFPRHTVICPPAGGQMTPACQRLSPLPSRTKKKIQGLAHSKTLTRRSNWFWTAVAIPRSGSDTALGTGLDNRTRHIIRKRRRRCALPAHSKRFARFVRHRHLSHVLEMWQPSAAFVTPVFQIIP